MRIEVAVKVTEEWSLVALASQCASLGRWRTGSGLHGQAKPDHMLAICLPVVLVASRLLHVSCRTVVQQSVQILPQSPSRLGVVETWASLTPSISPRYTIASLDEVVAGSLRRKQLGPGMHARGIRIDMRVPARNTANASECRTDLFARFGSSPWFVSAGHPEVVRAGPETGWHKLWPITVYNCFYGTAEVVGRLFCAVNALSSEAQTLPLIGAEASANAATEPAVSLPPREGQVWVERERTTTLLDFVPGRPDPALARQLSMRNAWGSVPGHHAAHFDAAQSASYSSWHDIAAQTATNHRFQGRSIIHKRRVCFYGPFSNSDGIVSAWASIASALLKHSGEWTKASYISLDRPNASHIPPDLQRDADRVRRLFTDHGVKLVDSWELAPAALARGETMRAAPTPPIAGVDTSIPEQLAMLAGLIARTRPESQPWWTPAEHARAEEAAEREWESGHEDGPAVAGSGGAGRPARRVVELAAEELCLMFSGMSSSQPAAASASCVGGGIRELLGGWLMRHARLLVRGTKGLIRAMAPCDAVIMASSGGAGDLAVARAAVVAGAAGVVLEVCGVQNRLNASGMAGATVLTGHSALTRDATAVELAWQGAQLCRAGATAFGYRGLSAETLAETAVPLRASDAVHELQTGHMPQQWSAGLRASSLPFCKAQRSVAYGVTGTPRGSSSAVAQPVVAMPLGTVPPVAASTDLQGASAAFQPWRERPTGGNGTGNGPECACLAFVGRLSPEKSPGLAVRLAALAAAQAGAACTVRLEVYGSGLLQSALLSLAARLNRTVAEGRLQLQLMGWMTRTELWTGLAARRCALLFPSVKGSAETFGMVAIEAMVSGVPVLTWGVGGSGEACIDGVTARILAPPWEMEMAAADVMSVFAPPGSRGERETDRLLTSAAEAAQRLFSTSALSQRYSDLLGCLVSCPGAEAVTHEAARRAGLLTRFEDKAGVGQLGSGDSSRSCVSGCVARSL